MLHNPKLSKQVDRLAPHFPTVSHFPLIIIRTRKIHRALASLNVCKLSGPDGRSSSNLKICISILFLFYIWFSTFEMHCKQAMISLILPNPTICWAQITIDPFCSRNYSKSPYPNHYIRPSKAKNSKQVSTGILASFHGRMAVPRLITSPGFDSRVATNLVFLGSSKAFDRVWHGGLPVKLSKSGCSRLSYYEHQVSSVNESLPFRLVGSYPNHSL